jgi:hypothetical protein
LKIVKSLDSATADAHAVYGDVVVAWSVIEVNGDERRHVVFLVVAAAVVVVVFVGGCSAVAVVIETAIAKAQNPPS